MAQTVAVKVAALQLKAVVGPGAIARNLAHAAPVIAHVAQKGNKFVVLPEVYGSGYNLHTSVWRQAERLDRSTVLNFVKEQSKAHKIYLGCGFFEVKGEDFYDSYIVGEPNGNLHVIRKTYPASFERFYFRGDNIYAPHVFETEYGKVGVLICAENLHSPTVQMVLNEKPSLLLSPWSAPGAPDVPVFPGKVAYEKMINDASLTIAKVGQVPTIAANQGCSWTGSVPFQKKIYTTEFMPLTRILNEKGEVVPDFDRSAEAELLAQNLIEKGEKVALGTVHLKKDRSADPTPKAPSYGTRGQYISEPPFVVKTIFRNTERMGAAYYTMSKERKAAAKDLGL